MKRSTVAALLSLVLPGAGLWYYGKRWQGAVNLVIAAVVPLAAGLTDFLSEHVLWIFLTIAAGSAGLAHATASDRGNHS